MNTLVSFREILAHEGNPRRRLYGRHSLAFIACIGVWALTTSAPVWIFNTASDLDLVAELIIVRR